MADSETIETIGGIYCVQGDFEFVWKIRYFSLLPAPVGRSYSSPPFNFCGQSLELIIFPNGDTKERSEGFVGLYLVESDRPLGIRCSVGIKLADGTQLFRKGKKPKYFGETSNCWGFSKFIRREELLRRKDEVLPLDVLTLTVTLKTRKDQASKQGVLKAIKNLWLSGDNSDVTIKVGDEQFKAHRTILAARTPVMASMFNHDTAEKLSGVVTIEDCEPMVFRKFLHYVYTGEVSELNVENASALFAVSDKYLVSGLKELCVRFLCRSLCLDTIYEVLTLPMVHKEKKLLDAATYFIAKNMVDVMKTAKWKKFLLENTTWANEIIIRALELERKSKKRALNSLGPNSTVSKKPRRR